VRARAAEFFFFFVVAILRQVFAVYRCRYCCACIVTFKDFAQVIFANVCLFLAVASSASSARAIFSPVVLLYRFS
jgi:hypothetical protein